MSRSDVICNAGAAFTMTYRLVIGVLIMGAVAMTGNAQQNSDKQEADLSALEKLLRAEMVAGNDGDTEALLDLRTADVAEMLPGDSTLVGEDAIRAAWSENYPYIDEFTNLSIEEIKVFGDSGVVRFSFVQTQTPMSGGESVVFNRRAMWVVQRQPDDSWKIAREMVNADNPAN